MLVPITVAQLFCMLWTQLLEQLTMQWSIVQAVAEGWVTTHCNNAPWPAVMNDGGAVGAC